MLWKPAKADLTTIKRVQGKAVSWIFMSRNNVIPYKDKLLSLDILPMYLYQERQVVLLFGKIVTEKVHIDWQRHVTNTAVDNRRVRVTRNFVLQTIETEET